MSTSQIFTLLFLLSAWVGIAILLMVAGGRRPRSIGGVALRDWIVGIVLVVVFTFVLVSPYLSVADYYVFRRTAHFATSVYLFCWLASVFLTVAWMRSSTEPPAEKRRIPWRPLGAAFVTAAVAGLLALLDISSYLNRTSATEYGYQSWRPSPRRVWQNFTEGLTISIVILLVFWVMHAWGTFVARGWWGRRFEHRMSMDYRAAQRETLESRLLYLQEQFEAGAIDETTLKEEARRLLDAAMTKTPPTPASQDAT